MYTTIKESSGLYRSCPISRVRYNECKSIIPGTWEAEAEGLEVGRKPRQFGKLVSKNNWVTQLSHNPSQKKKGLKIKSILSIVEDTKALCVHKYHN